MFIYKIDGKTELSFLQKKDAEELFQLVDRSRERLRKWLPWVDFTTSVKNSETFIDISMQQFASNNGFQAAIKYEGRIAGVVGFHAVNWDNKSASLGYWLGEGFEGKGLMTSSCRAMIDYAFFQWNLQRIEIRAATENKKSQAIPKRLGFTEEGCIRESEWLENSYYVSHKVYGLLNREWRC